MAIADMGCDRSRQVDNVYFDSRSAQGRRHIQVPAGKIRESNLLSRLVGSLRLIEMYQTPGIYDTIAR